jgi:thioredoxin 2
VLAVTPRGDIVRCDACETKNRIPANATGVPKCGKCGSALPWITEAEDGDFDEVVAASSVPVLVDLWAEWCGPCRMVSPVLEQVAHEKAGTLKLVKINVDKSPSLARRFEALSIPTLLILKGGDVIARRIGAAPLNEIQRWVDDTLQSKTA